MADESTMSIYNGEWERERESAVSFRTTTTKIENEKKFFINCYYDGMPLSQRRPVLTCLCCAGRETTTKKVVRAKPTPNKQTKMEKTKTLIDLSLITDN